MQVIPPEIKKIVDNWNIRALVILSLIFQMSLTFLAPLRKRTWKTWLAMIIWMSYLLADWTANYAVAQITKNQGKEPKHGDPPKNKKLLALWAPFLLLHLGGPDTITALSLEDNALWKRHMFGLVSQALAGVYAVVQSLDNVLWPPITLIFITGTIKYLEKTVALYSASFDNFKNSMYQSSNMLNEEWASREKLNIPTNIIVMDNDEMDMRPRELDRPDTILTNLEILQYGFKFFDTFKGLVIDLIFSFSERYESRGFFLRLIPEEALRIIETELGFFYELLYTKTVILNSKCGIMFRVIAFGSLLSSLYLFHRRPLKSDDVHGTDVVITYVLYIVGIALDLTSMLMILLSDWTLATMRKLKDDPKASTSCIDRLLNWYLACKSPRWKEHRCNGNRHDVLTTGFWSRRWSGTIYGFNFIGYCLKAKVSRIHQKTNLYVSLWDFVVVVFDVVIRRIQMWFRRIRNVNRSVASVLRQWSTTNRMIRYTVNPLFIALSEGIKVFGKLWGYIDRIFRVTSFLDEIRFISREPLTKNQWEFIFYELKDKSDFAERPEDAKKVFSARGEWALRDTNSGKVDALMRYVENADYDQSLLLWHIATELCFQEEEDTKEIANLSRESYNDREFSKIISDYMMYLLIMQPKLMSEVAGIGTIRFRDTLAEAERFFNGRHKKDLINMKQASNRILSVSTNIEPIFVKGDLCKSVLFDASMLAKELQKMKESRDEDGKWTVLRKVWIELLSYAASHCKAKRHVAQLSRGGELLNFVWLLMAHFGLADQFQTDKGEAGAKMVVGK